MNTSARNFPEPGITFHPQGDKGLDCDCALEWNPNPDAGRLQIHEVYGADKFLVSLGQPKLLVTFECSFSYLHSMELALKAYREKLQKRGGLTTENTESTERGPE